MFQRRTFSCAAVAAAISVIVATDSATAQQSPLYMVSYDTNQVVVIQNGILINSWTNGGAFLESALAIGDTIRMVGRNPGQNGAEYALDGTPLGGGPYFNPEYDDLYDGTTNGVNNYAVAHNDFDVDFAVVVGDANWDDLQVAFVPSERSSGIAYDAGTDTLWLANNIGGFTGLQQYGLDGTLLNTIFVDPVGGAGYGIAWDPIDDTLWMTGGFGSGIDAYQLDKNGNILQSLDVEGISGNWISAEIAIPAPGVLPLIVIGVFGAGRRRRRL